MCLLLFAMKNILSLHIHKEQIDFSSYSARLQLKVATKPQKKTSQFFSTSEFHSSLLD